MHNFPLLDALWASIDNERPSGDDPKKVAFALSQFFQAMSKNLAERNDARWRTPLYTSLQPRVDSLVEQLRELTKKLNEQELPFDPKALEHLKTWDLELRKAAFELEAEEKKFEFPKFESPKLSYLSYLFEGWKRGLLAPEPLKSFVDEFKKDVLNSGKEIAEASQKINPKASEAELEAVEQAKKSVSDLFSNLTQLRNSLTNGAPAAEPAITKVLSGGETLIGAFKQLEQCSPITEPCPFCGGQISLSGRCRSCTRRLPHLEEASGTTETEIHSDFLSANCRALDIPLQQWQQNPEDGQLWAGLVQAVRTFSGHVSEGRKTLDMLASASDRPIDPEHPSRKREKELKSVAEAFTKSLSSLSRFTQQQFPPQEPLEIDWKETLLAAELKLQGLQLEFEPEPDQELADS